MAKTPPPDSAPEQLPAQADDDSVLEDSFYEVPAELSDETVQAGDPGRPPPLEDHELDGPDGPEEPEEASEPADAPRGKRPFPMGKVALAVVALAAIGAVLMIFRAQERRRAVREGIAKAETMMRLDTADGYRKAADLLAPLAQLDPLEAGSARAFSLAMLAADYREARAEADANALLVVPGRADAIPRYAALAFAALALGKNSLGDATSALGNAPGTPWTDALQARIALRAGTLEAAVAPATAAAAVSAFTPGLAVHGDVARRTRQDARTARTAYEAALAASPAHPRAAYGLAKLALAGEAPEAEAREALERLLSGEAAPGPERARAALHLAALRIRAGEPLSAVRADAGAVVGDKPLDWLMGAARTEAAHRGPYRAVAGAPQGLESASDDDPPDLKALPPEPPPPPPPAVEPPRPPPTQKGKAAAHAAKVSKPGAKATAKKPAAKGAAKATAKKPAAKATAKATAKKSAAKAASKTPATKKKPAGK